jgi:histidinol phosphatase-like enzyme
MANLKYSVAKTIGEVNILRQLEIDQEEIYLVRDSFKDMITHVEAIVAAPVNKEKKKKVGYGSDEG